MNERWNLWRPRPSSKHQSRLLRYGLAILFPILAVLLVYERPVLLNSPFYVFFASVIMSAAYGGLAAGFVSTALSLFFLRFLFINPSFDFLHPPSLDHEFGHCRPPPGTQ